MKKLVNWLKKLRSKSGGWGWVTKLLAAAIGFLTVGFLAYKNWKQGKKLAKLLHERDVAVQEKAAAELSKLLESSQKMIDEKRRKIEKMTVEMAALEFQLEQVENEKLETAKTIDAIKSWDGVDRFLSNDGSDEGGS